MNAQAPFEPGYRLNDELELPEVPWPLDDGHTDAEHWIDVFPRPTWRNPIRKLRGWWWRWNLKRGRV